MLDPSQILARSLQRDEAIRSTGRQPEVGTEAAIIDFVIKHELYDEQVTRNWLIDRSSSESWGVRERLLGVIQPLLQHGHAADAVAAVSTFLAMKTPESGERRRKVFDSMRVDLRTIIQNPENVLAHPNTWGDFLIQLETTLLTDNQLERQKRIGTTSSNDHFQHVFYQADRIERDPWMIVGKGVELGLATLAVAPTSTAFSSMTRTLYSKEWGVLKCHPLVILCDYFQNPTAPIWQRDEAVRLLSLTETRNEHSTLHWRRLLAHRIRQLLSESEQSTLLECIRSSSATSRTRRLELSDFKESGRLAEAESKEVEAARHQGELFEPFDPRERRIPKMGFGTQSQPDPLITAWPHENEKALLRLFITSRDGDPGPETSISDDTIRRKLAAMRVLMTHQEVDSPTWFCEFLNWNTALLGQLKTWYREHYATVQIGYDQYLGLLEEHVPWWEDRTTTALETLAQTPPESHLNRETDDIVWTSDDRFAASFKYIDEVLAIPAGPRFESYRDRLKLILTEKWDSWPSYTRGLAIVLLRTYHWVQQDDTTNHLVTILETENNSHDIEVALGHLLRCRRPGVARIMQSLLERVDGLTDPNEIVYLIGSVIGNALVRYRGDQEENKELAEFASWYDKITTGESPSKSSDGSLVISILDAAATHLKSRSELRDSHFEIWSKLLQWAVQQWISTAMAKRDGLPILPVSSTSEMPWTEPHLTRLLEYICELLSKLLQQGSLASFYEVHYELRKLLNGGKSKFRPPPVEILVGLCRESAIRVANWRKENRSTNDMAYAMSLNGSNTYDLIVRSFECTPHREYARRELAPVIDILADAGFVDLSSDLRAKLREY